jgi:ribonucleoside-diphosphate reductase alpha chain
MPAKKRKNPRLTIEPHFFGSDDGDGNAHPYDTVEWRKSTAHMEVDGEVVFHQDNVEVPKGWTEDAAYIVASKYFRGHVGTKGRESSVKQLFDRVVNTITEFGVKHGYFDKRDGRTFNLELKKILIDQRAAFNSPVFFNVGALDDPQGSACFILGISDSLKSIAKVQDTEIKIFSQGSGSGVNLSPLRGVLEPLSRGGWASGPMSFFRGYNAWGGVIRSGGVLRRASKFNRLDDWHQDIFNGKENGSDFISFKAHEERKARALVMAGYSPEEAYATVSGQNANLSVGISDEFMQAALEGKDWPLKYVNQKGVSKTVNAADMIDSIARNCHFCGDPGVQFHSTVNNWNTCPKSGEITSSNPCGEFLFLANSACNLASINLSKFISLPEGLFFEEEFCKAVRLMTIAMDIIVDLSHYPTEEITINSKEFRPLGLGFTNLGGMVMALGLPYDSREARMWGSSISALLTGMCYKTSIELATVKGPFKHFQKNRNPMMKVLRQHESKVNELITSMQGEFAGLISRAQSVWSDVIRDALKHGIRNAQATNIAPTGTIALLMDASTTGIESGNWLTTRKKLVDGGYMNRPLRCIQVAIDTLGYSEADKIAITEYIKEKNMIEGCNRLRKDHLAVFDTAYRNGKGDRTISPDGHLLMMAACQPFISGGISKTIGRPEDATVQEFKDIIFKAWRLGLKSVTVYRDGSKVTQPLSGAGKDAKTAIMATQKRGLPWERNAKNYTVRIGQSKLYMGVGFYPEDTKVGEIFLTLGKAGSALTGWVDALALSISVGLQHQIPLSVYVDKFSDLSFDPKGFTSHPRIKFARSVPDLVVRMLAEFDKESQDVLGMNGDDGPPIHDTEEIPIQKDKTCEPKQTGEMCEACGNLMVQINSTCKRCSACPNSEGMCGG